MLNKIDSISIEELELLDRVPHYVPVSARHLWGVDELLEKIWQYVGMVRIYTKPRGQIPDYNSPVILHEDARSIEDFCDKIHKAMAKQLKVRAVPPSEAARGGGVAAQRIPLGSAQARGCCFADPLFLPFSLKRTTSLLPPPPPPPFSGLQYAWVWGASVKHQPQRVGKDHFLEDEDVVQLVKRGA